MKNIAKKLLTTILSVALLAGCAPTTKKESSTPKETPKIVDPVDVNVAALKGPTSMGMVQMMKEMTKVRLHPTIISLKSYLQ